MNTKTAIMNAIERGLSNQEILAQVPTSASYIAEVRFQYNQVAPEPIRSKRPKRRNAPKEGTVSRAVYDLIAANANIESAEIVAKTGVNYGVIQWVKTAYFGHKPKPWPRTLNKGFMNSVDLSELSL
jgi:hypothetical protein